MYDRSDAQTKMAPDKTFKRYKTDTFKTSLKKRVPYEEIDFNVYKPSSNQVAFQTTESRLTKWIEAFLYRYYESPTYNNDNIQTRWNEQDDENEPSKCENIELEIIYKKDVVLTITIYVSTGRIQILGKHMREWGSCEFQHILKIINMDEPTTIHYTDHNNTFLEKITKKTANISKDEPSEDTTPSDSPREKSLLMLKTHMANLEADFVSYKLNNDSNIKQLNETINKKDEEISKLNREIASLKATNIDKQQAISDLSMKQYQFEEQISLLMKNQQKKQDNNTNLINSMIKKQNELQAVNTTSPNSQNEDHEDTTTETSFTVPTSNSFQALVENEEAPDHPTTPTKTQPDHQIPNLPNPKETKQPPIKAETIIMCDSNGRYLKPSLLCPNSTTHYIRCPTLEDATKILNEKEFPNANCFIIHCGTNDLEKETDTTVQTHTQNTITMIQNKYPKTRIILSSLLPRADNLNTKATTLNNNIKKAMSDKPNISLVPHNNIGPQDLKDSKHLTQKSVKLFAKNLKSAYFNTSPKKEHQRRRTSPFSHQRKSHPWTYPYTHLSPFSKPTQTYPPHPTTYHQPNQPHHNLHTPPPPLMSQKFPQNTTRKHPPSPPVHQIPPHLKSILQELQRWIN